MGEPVFNPADIPVKHEGADCVSTPVVTSEGEYEITCVSMGNPHAVIYVDSLESVDIGREGPAMENHIMFPNRVNTEFVKVIDRNNLHMRVWERGSGETLACGTGACAVLAASVLNGKSEREATVRLLGGELVIKWDESDNHIYMTGPAETVFEGVIDL
jgi:diaminopimelate epimerase